MLNLRQLGEPDNETEDTSNSKPSALLFSGPRFRAPTTMASIIGNMGEDLHYGPEELDADNLFEEANVGGSSEEAIMDAAPGITSHEIAQALENSQRSASVFVLHREENSR